MTGATNGLSRAARAGECRQCGAPTVHSRSGMCRLCATRDGRRRAKEAPPYFWHPDAACDGHPDPDLWFPDKNEWQRAIAAKTICVGCPVRQGCFEYAMHRPGQAGVWGGTSPEDRLNLAAGRVTLSQVDSKTGWEMRRILNPSEEALKSRVRAIKQRAAARDAEHGTRPAYTAGCRCEACTKANTSYLRDYRERRANGTANGKAPK